MLLSAVHRFILTKHQENFLDTLLFNTHLEVNSLTDVLRIFLNQHASTESLSNCGKDKGRIKVKKAEGKNLICVSEN